MNTDHSSLQSLHLYFHLFKWPTALVKKGNTRETDGQEKEAGKHREGETVSKRTKLQKLKRILKHTPSLVRMLRFSSFSLFFFYFHPQFLHSFLRSLPPSFLTLRQLFISSSSAEAPTTSVAAQRGKQ